MKKIKIITDSTAYITREEASYLDVEVIPLSYNIDGHEYIEGFPGEFSTAFEVLKKSKNSLKTSQPPVGKFIKAYKDAFNKGYEAIIGVFLSNKLSGTYNSACLASDILENKNIYIINSNSTAGNLKCIIRDIRNLIIEGKEILEVLDIVDERIKNSRILLTVDTLEYLSKGGRISSLQSKLGNIFNVKPILELEDGEIILREKLRGKKQALNKMIDMIDPNCTEVGIYHVNSLQEAEIISRKIREVIKNKKIYIGELGPVVGAHLGPGGIGICLY